MLVELDYHEIGVGQGVASMKFALIAIVGPKQNQDGLAACLTLCCFLFIKNTTLFFCYNIFFKKTLKRQHIGKDRTYACPRGIYSG